MKIDRYDVCDMGWMPSDNTIINSESVLKKKIIKVCKSTDVEKLEAENAALRQLVQIKCQYEGGYVCEKRQLTECKLCKGADDEERR